MSNTLPHAIDVQQLKKWLDDDEDLLLLDCREPQEHEYCRIEQAVLIPTHELSARVGELQAYRDKPVVVYCHHGVRSLRVASWLRQCGFDAAQSLSGGIDAWSLEIDPDVPRYERR